MFGWISSYLQVFSNIDTLSVQFTLNCSSVGFKECETVAGADSSGSQQFRAAGGQGQQPSTREVSRSPGQLIHPLQLLL